MRLRRYVHIDGKVFGPGDQVPEEVADRITNPKAWETAPAGRAVAAPVPENTNPGDDENDEEPERPAKDAPVATWREYILAVADVTEAEVNEMTKAELVSTADQLDDE